MQVSVENTGTLERKLRIEVPEGQISTEVNDRLQKLTKTARLEGFRPGKAPLKVIKGRYGAKVRKEVVDKLVESSFYEAINQENLKLAGSPQIDNIDDETGKDLTYTATFEVYPVMNLKSFDRIEFEKPVCAVSDDDVTKMIETVREQRQELKPIDRPAESGDVVDIDFEGFLDGEPLADGKASHYQLELGSKHFIDGFEAGLLGKSAGEELTLKLTFPDDYGNDTTRGKDVEFNVKINVVNETVLPEVDAAFMAAFGVKDGNEDAFRNEIRQNMERRAAIVLRHQTREKMLDKLYTENTVELPQAMVAREYHRIQHELENKMEEQGVDASITANTDPSLLNAQAEKRVALQLIVGEIIQQNGLKADPVKVRKRVEQRASPYENPAAIINEYYSGKNNLAEVEAQVLEDEVIEWVLQHGKVVEKASTFDDIMNNRQTSA